VYGSLEPNGPFLQLEKNASDDWLGDQADEEPR
jgi:hypothetical protein